MKKGLFSIKPRGWHLLDFQHAAANVEVALRESDFDTGFA
jgi:hypothetical protein